MTHHLHPDNLEKYSFIWSEARLLIAAIALFLGGVPPIYLILPTFRVTSNLLLLSWLISGMTAVYLAYRWHLAKYTLFSKNDSTDTFAFVVMVVSGINLGLAGLLGRNIGMSIWSGRIIFIVVGALYVWTAYYLWNRWQKSGKRLF